jgi:hypothetical protein
MKNPRRPCRRSLAADVAAHRLLRLEPRLRYPGLIGDSEQELTPDRLADDPAWHEADPVLA